MSQRWYSPKEKWPPHSKDWFRDALEMARARGWSLLKFESYGYGAVYCGREEDVEGEPCSYVIFKTATAGEDGAKDLRKLVAKCPHRPPEAVIGAQARLGEAEAALDAAARLISAARLLTAARESRERADELLSEAAAAIDGAEALARAVEAEEGADAAEAEAAATLTEVGGGLGRAEAIEDAASQIGVAERALGRVKNRPEKRVLLARAEALRQELDALRGVSGFSPGT